MLFFFCVSVATCHRYYAGAIQWYHPRDKSFALILYNKPFSTRIKDWIALLAWRSIMHIQINHPRFMKCTCQMVYGTVGKWLGLMKNAFIHQSNKINIFNIFITTQQWKIFFKKNLHSWMIKIYRTVYGLSARVEYKWGTEIESGRRANCNSRGNSQEAARKREFSIAMSNFQILELKPLVDDTRATKINGWFIQTLLSLQHYLSKNNNTFIFYYLLISSRKISWRRKN